MGKASNDVKIYLYNVTKNILETIQSEHQSHTGHSSVQMPKPFFFSSFKTRHCPHCSWICSQVSTHQLKPHLIPPSAFQIQLFQPQCSLEGKYFVTHSNHHSIIWNDRKEGYNNSFFFSLLLQIKWRWAHIHRMGQYFAFIAMPIVKWFFDLNQLWFTSEENLLLHTPYTYIQRDFFLQLYSEIFSLADRSMQWCLYMSVA